MSEARQEQTSPSLLALTNLAAFRAFRAEPARWLPIARDIAREHNIAWSDPVVFATGTNLVVGLGDRLILKIFPPFHRRQFISERGTLRALAGQLRIDVPELVAEGERERWPYLFMTRLPGVAASEVWPGMAEADKERVLRQLGETIASVQQVPPGELLKVTPAWADVMQGQFEGCFARHQRLGLAPKFLDGLDDLLREVRELIPMRPRPVILVGEYIPENFQVARKGDGWRLCGLFDFGDVFTGFGDYDLLGPSAFMSAGRPRRVRSLLEGYGYAMGQIDASFKRCLMALMLLHRASDPNRHICIPDWSSKAADLWELQELIWPT
ncbi:aminoglycoside phosphotransferase family protein [Bradyrhizobium sp. STM 3557]|uniref:aminoglycoside phosphotransferase family protein n=1 Tax=Bradyrhizobium sp. STM 3557 TaxID=578920 RepID=UPI003890EC79